MTAVMVKGLAMIDIHGLCLAAEARIRPYISQTPLEPSINLGRENGGRYFSSWKTSSTRDPSRSGGR
jgi:hypothetical protein